MEKQEERAGEPARSEIFAPKKLAFSENVILTIKVLTGAGVFGGLIWALDYFTA